MISLPNIPEPAYKRVVMVGAGFAGLRLIRSLIDKDFQLVLMDRNNFHQFQPLYYQVATSGLEPSSITFPLRKLFQGIDDFHFRMADLQSVDPEKKEIQTSIGNLGYDILVLGLGATTNYFGNRQIEDKSVAMKSIPEAIRMRNLLLENYEEALNLPDGKDQEQVMNIVVVGGGPTGVELAGAIADMKKFVFPADYPELDFSRMKVYLLEAADRLLGPMSEFAARRATKYLDHMGVIIKTGAAVQSFDGKSVHLATGEEIPGRTVMWAAGVRVPDIAGLEKSARGHGGRYVVDRFNRLAPFNDIYVLGDQAIMTEDAYPKGHPQVAQPAIQQARLLAANLLRQKNGLPMKPFTYRDKGTMATIGRNKAVADIAGMHFGGRIAWLIWLLVHLMAIVGSKNRLFIFFNWAWNYLTYDQSLRLIIPPYGR